MSINLNNGIKGRTDGVAVPAGFVGERISSSTISQTSTVSANTFVDVTGASLPLTKGNWLVFFTGQLRHRNLSGATRNITGRLLLTDVANNPISGGVCYMAEATLASGGDSTNNQSFTVNVNISADTTYKLRLECTDSNTNGAVLINTGTQAFDAFDCVPLFYAIRLT